MYYDRSVSWPAPHRQRSPEYRGPISIYSLAEIFSGCGDFETRDVDFGLEGRVFVRVCWLDGLVSAGDVTEQVLRPLTESFRARGAATEADCIARILSGGVYRCAVHRRSDLDTLVNDLTHGHCAILFDASQLALSFELRSERQRAIDQPVLEKSLKGGKDSFSETLRVNTALVRQRIGSPKLKLAETTVGRKSRTRVAVLFVEGLADGDTVRTLARRIEQLDVDALLATGTLEESIVDAPRSPFPQLLHTERPDRFAMYLMDGRVGLLVDGLPVGLVLPVTLAEFMKVTGDSSMHFLTATALTLLRYGALLIALLLPAAYVAVAMYHQEMIPTRLLLSIIDAERQVPFSTALEVLSMLAAFSLLQEAGLRLPNPMGDTVSIIGALIVGQAAVEAQVVSPIAIIVVAISGICCYTLPSQDLGYAVRLSRLALLAGAIAGGLYGLNLVLCLLLLHLAGIDSFGLPYAAPLCEGRPGGLFRLLIRLPKPLDKFRDPLLRGADRRRQR